MITSTTDLFNERGDDFGLELSVQIGFHPPVISLWHHLLTVPTLTPTYLATFLIDQFRYFTNLTACMRTFGRLGFVVYAMLYILPPQVLHRY